MNGQWGVTAGSVLFEHTSTPSNNDNFDKLTRKDQATIFCLRTQHIPLNSHLNRIGATAEKACPLCNHTEETVEHHLFYCTKLEDLREIFLPSQPDTQNTLFGTVNQLKNTYHFHYMSLRQRARAHELLDC